MIRLAILILTATFLGYSCTSQSTSPEANKQKTIKDALKEIKSFEKKIKNQSTLNEATAVEYADKCLAVAHDFPKSKEAPQMMNKAHVILSSVGLYQRSVVLADSIIIMYPTYEKRVMVLESLASSYDIFIVPRKKEMVKKYYEMLLQEGKSMDSIKRQSIENRLKFIDLSFEDYIKQQTNH